jgi:ATP-binding cassette, subfamily C (CFTR/MRP), member 4
VGRTGAGKSSIIQALFRIVEPEGGQSGESGEVESPSPHYSIGGHDALKMGLHSLRQHISVIPQTPFLFRGTVRQNVDPFATESEERVWAVLSEAGL